FMKSNILPEFDKSSEKELRIWSAGCSTGEEPYTIAMTLLDYYSAKDRPQLLILATDIDTQVLTKGVDGVYPEDHLSTVDPGYIKKYFHSSEGDNIGYYRVDDILKEIVYFRRLNLLQEAYPMKRKFNVIFCRNVIIYFDRETQKKLFSKFYEYLKDDGYLLIG